MYENVMKMEELGKQSKLRLRNTKLKSEFQEVKMIEEEKQWEGNDDVAASRFEKNVLNHDMKSGSDDEKPKVNDPVERPA
ncbi:hypothetical protein V6N13_122597 [Hibiscus sabdariffa]